MAALFKKKSSFKSLKAEYDADSGSTLHQDTDEIASHCDIAADSATAHQGTDSCEAVFSAHDDAAEQQVTKETSSKKFSFKSPSSMFSKYSPIISDE